MALSEQQAAQTASATPTTAIASSTIPPKGRRRWGRWLAASILLVFLALLFYVGLFIARPAWQGYRAAQDLLAIARGGLNAAQAPAIEDAILRADVAYNALADGSRPFHFLLRRLGFVPQWGGTLALAPELIEIGREGSAMAAEIAPALATALAADGMLQKGAALSATLADDPERLERLAQHAERIAVLVPALPVEHLEPRIAAILAEVQPLAPLLPDMVRALPGVSVLLGQETPHTFLLIVQNNHELRPTGGFITAVGRLTFDQGEIVEMDFSDSYAIADYKKLHPPPPAPMKEYMGLPYLVFRDANWSPDLPTSSGVAHALYQQDAGLDYDATVTVDLFAVERIMDALAPISIDKIDTPLTGGNILEIIKELWARPPDAEGGESVAIDKDLGEWWRNRKDFIPLLAQAVLQKVMSGDADYGALAAAAITALDNREIQMVSNAPGVRGLLAERGWNGALEPPSSGDYIALVEANFGYNKANAAIEREMHYVVTPPLVMGDRATTTLVITYTHTIDAEDPGCDQTPRYGTSYDDMIARCFFNYLRVYVPPGSELVEMTGVYAGTITSQRAEKNTQQFAGYFILPPDESNTVTITYLLSPEVSQLLADGVYTLRVQRQSGSGPLPLSVHVGEEMLATTLEAGSLDWAPFAE